MKNLHPPLALLALLGLAGAAQAADTTTVWQGPPGATGDVQVLNANGLVVDAPASLQDVQLVPVDFSGRTALDALRPDRPRLRTDVAGASRIQLPAGVGSVYGYRRDEAGGNASYGYFRIDPAGLPTVLFEHAGCGALGDQNPFVDRLAVDPTGTGLLVATKPAAGGDLYEVLLAGPAVLLRSAALPPLDAGGAGLALTADWGVAATASGVVHFDRTTMVDGTFVDFGTPAPAWFSRELATSPNGESAITVAGTDPTLAHAWVFGPVGPAAQASTLPGEISGAGYLPESNGGPWLAVSDDGTLCAWRTVEPLAREAWLAEVGPQATAPVQVSEDQHFLDTLDEVGQFLIFGSKLLLTVGEATDPVLGGFDFGDVFEIGLDPGGAPVMSNVTLSSGQATAPFTVKPTLSANALAWLPDASAFLIQGDDATSELLLRAAPGAAPDVLLDQVKDLDLMEEAGGSILLVLRRSFGSKPRELFRLAADGTLSPLFTLPDVSEPLRPSARPGGWVAFATPDAFFGEFLWRVELASGLVQRLTPRRLLWRGPLDLRDDGTLASSVGGPLQPATYVRWLAGFGPYRLGTFPAPGIVLAP